MSSWERPGRIDGPGAFLENSFIKIGTKKLSATSRPGHDDPSNPDLQRPSRISASPDIIMAGLPGTKGGTSPSAVLKGPPSLDTKNAGNARKQNANSPPPTHSHKAVHLGSGLGVPDLHEVVVRPTYDAISVRGERDGPNPLRVTRHRANLPPTHLYLRGWSGRMSGFLVRPLIAEMPVRIYLG